MDESNFSGRFVAPYFKEIPREILARWVKATKGARLKTIRALAQAVPGRADFDRKIYAPTLAFFKRVLKKEYPVERGRLIEKNEQHWKLARRRYFQNRAMAYKPKNFRDDIELGKAFYGKSWCNIKGPLEGYPKGKIKGLAAFGMMALTGVKDLKNYLKDNDRIMDEPVCVVAPKKLAEFKRRLWGKLLHGGAEIINLAYHPRTLQQANQSVNELVGKYRLPEFTVSVDFIVVEIPDPADRLNVRTGNIVTTG